MSRLLPSALPPSALEMNAPPFAKTGRKGHPRSCRSSRGDRRNYTQRRRGALSRRAPHALRTGLRREQGFFVLQFPGTCTSVARPPRPGNIGPFGDPGRLPPCRTGLFSDAPDGAGELAVLGAAWLNRGRKCRKSPTTQVLQGRVLTGLILRVLLKHVEGF